MPPTEDAFVRAIIEAPADDAVRLIFADWLEDRGESARATFIRFQCRRAELMRFVESWAGKASNERGGELGAEAGAALAEAQALERRECELLSGGRDYEWFFPRGAFRDPASWTYQRGFVADVTCTLADWLARGAAIVSRHPVERVTLAGAEPEELRVWQDWNWWKNTVNDHPDTLPPAVFDLLEGGEPDTLPGADPVWRAYPTRDAALGALSAALLRHAREAKGR